MLDLAVFSFHSILKGSEAYHSVEKRIVIECLLYQNMMEKMVGVMLKLVMVEGQPFLVIIQVELEIL